MRSDVCYFNEARYAVAKKRVDHQPNGKSSKRDEPPAPPDSRQDREGHSRRRGCDSTAGTDRAHQKLVTARCEIGKVDCAPLRWRAPVGISPFEFVLIAQHFAGGEAQANEIDLHLVL